MTFKVQYITDDKHYVMGLNSVKAWPPQKFFTKELNSTFGIFTESGEQHVRTEYGILKCNLSVGLKLPSKVAECLILEDVGVLLIYKQWALADFR